MKFELATPKHDPELRALLRGAEMPGWIRLAFAREPNFFHAAGVQGEVNQVLAAVENERVVGVGCRSVRSSFVDGRERKIGYLSGLRLLPEVRGTGALARGYAALKRLHDEAPVPFYTTTIVDGNLTASTMLTSGRAGLPHYLDRGQYFTYAINTRRRKLADKGVVILRGDEAGVANIVSFLRETGARRQFFPAIKIDAFGSDLLRGLRAEDFLVAVTGQSRIVGALAVWDQSAFKQSVVQGYAGPVALSRPAINGALRMAGFAPLPGAGQALKAAYAAFICIANDDVRVLCALLERAREDNRRKGRHLLLAGFHDCDPLRAAMRHFPVFRYASRLYLVCWDDGLEAVKGLDATIVPYLELATL